METDTKKMKYASFAGGDRQVSKLGFGAWGLSGIFGQHTEEEMIDSVLFSLERGINLIDTARDYRDSERILGKALKRWSGEAPFIATKIQPLGPGLLRWGQPMDINEVFPKGWVKKCFEESLSQLDMEKVNLVQMHTYWANWGTSGYWLDELHELKEKGLTDYVGVSAPDHRQEMVIPLVTKGLVDSVQTIFNIHDPLAHDCLIPICEENNVSVIARCVLNDAILTEAIKPNMTFDKGDIRNTLYKEFHYDEYKERIDKLKKFIPEYAENLPALAIKFATFPSGVTTALSSMHIKEYAGENIKAIEDTPITLEVYEELRKHHRWIKNLYSQLYWKQPDEI